MSGGDSLFLQIGEHSVPLKVAAGEGVQIHLVAQSGQRLGNIAAHARYIGIHPEKRVVHGVIWNRKSPDCHRRFHVQQSRNKYFL